MPVLDNLLRITAMRRWIRREYVAKKIRADFDTVLLKESIDNIDDWLEANLTKLNNALPLEFKQNATLKQKYALLIYVLEQRMK